jgi:hypothetical protein
VDPIARGDKELGEIGAVLSCDARYQRNFGFGRANLSTIRNIQVDDFPAFGTLPHFG